MRLNHQVIRELAEKRGESLKSLLERAGVSRTAYYSLLRRPNILPRTVRALAEELGRGEAALLIDSHTHPRLTRAREICRKHPDADFDNVWHTLTLLEQSPLERLRGSLRRARV